MYENMVKEAYDQIMGFDKEAAPNKAIMDLHTESAMSPSKRKLFEAKLDQAEARAERGAVRAEMKALKKSGKGKGTEEYNALQNRDNELKGKRNQAILTRLNPVTNVKAVGRSISDPYREFGRAPGKAIASQLFTPAYMSSAFDRSAGKTLGQAKIMAERAAKKEQAEKAAAYYDEAQLVKEAAERDYQEACAYEEAALSILDELGYLD